MSKPLKFEFSFALGEEVKSSLFGSNFVFVKNGINADTNQILQDLSVRDIRYPGGSATEYNFDYRNPDIPVDDNSLHYDNDQSTTPTTLTLQEFTPLTSFLDWAESTGKSATIVLPTRNLIDQSAPHGTSPRAVNAEAVTDLKSFLLNLLAESGPNGNALPSADIKALEIGNEYWGSGNMTSVEYGIVAGAVIATIGEVIDELGITAKNSPDILVQMASPWGMEFRPGGMYAGINANSPKALLGQFNLSSSDFLSDGSLSWLTKIRLANSDIINNMPDDARNSIDGVIEHYYYQSAEDLLKYASASVNYIDRDYSIWSNALGRELDLHITEWNVKSTNLAQLGLKGAGVVIEQIENLIRLGADSAFVWPYQHNTRNDLAGSPGDSDGFTPLGAAFKLTAESIVGTRRLDSNISGGELEVNAYSSNEKFVFFVTSRSDAQKTAEIDFGDLVSSYATVSGEKIGVDLSTSDGRHWTPNGFTQAEYFNENDVRAQLTHYSEDELGVASNISFVLDPYEVMRLEFLLDAAVEFSGTNDDDRWDGGAGYDFASGSFGEDTLRGFDGNDTLAGGNGHDELAGGGGHDQLYGGAGEDLIAGDLGNDTIDGGAGDDTLQGGAGFDSINYFNASTSVLVDLLTNAVSGWAAGDTISGFESVYGSNTGNDTLLGTKGDNILRGYGGNDIVYDRAGDDNVDLGDGNDTVLVGNGADTLIGGNGIDNVNYYYSSGGVNVDLLTNLLSGGWAADDKISGFERVYGSNTGGDVLKGTNGANFLRGYGGNDLIYDRGGNDNVDLGAGNDTVIVGGGADTLTGGSGIDNVSYFNSTSGVNVDLFTNATSGGWAADDTISGFERVYGSNVGNDILKGTNGANFLRGYGGNDIVYDRGGDDNVDLGDGNDTVLVGNGADTLIGGNGIDNVNYYYSSAGVNVDLLTNALSGGWAADDSISGFERVYGSNTGGDVLKGTNGANFLRGYGGNDRLDGRAGNDNIDGGAGADTLTGGTGVDHFVFGKNYGADCITDFADDVDTLVLDDALWGGGLTEVQVFSTYASIIGGDVVFDFGSGDTITFQGISSPGLLLDDILLV